MAICANCGNELEDGDIFCPNCGKKASEIPPIERKSVPSSPATVSKTVETASSSAKGPRMRKTTMLAALAVIVFLVVAGSFFAHMRWPPVPTLIDTATPTISSGQASTTASYQTISTYTSRTDTRTTGTGKIQTDITLVHLKVVTGMQIRGFLKGRLTRSDNGEGLGNRPLRLFGPLGTGYLSIDLRTDPQGYWSYEAGWLAMPSAPAGGVLLYVRFDGDSTYERCESSYMATQWSTLATVSTTTSRP